MHTRVSIMYINSTKTILEKFSRMQVVLVFIGLTIVCWFLLVIGFGIGSNEDEDENV